MNHLKQKFRTSLLFFSCAFSASQLFAATVAGKIDAVQAPAWLDRGGLTVPVSPEIVLQVGDTLRTGRSARLLLKLGDGSFVQLGENAQFVIDQTSIKPAPKGGIYQAALSVVSGAFRFTTAALAKVRPRQISVNIARNVTIGIRGTDLWGRGHGDKDIVCLIEGSIEVTGNDGKPLRLDQPLQFFQSTRSAPPAPLAFVDKKQLDIWSAETAIEPGKGAAAKGIWRVNIGGFATRGEMLASRSVLRNAGYPAENSADNILTVANFSNETGARELASQFTREFGLKEVSVVNH